MRGDSTDETEKKLVEMQVEIGVNIRKIRKAKKLTQEALGKKIGISKQLISMTESGTRNLTLATMIEFAQALDCHINDFIPQSPPSVGGGKRQ